MRIALPLLLVPLVAFAAPRAKPRPRKPPPASPAPKPPPVAEPDADPKPAPTAPAAGDKDKDKDKAGGGTGAGATDPATDPKPPTDPDPPKASNEPDVDTLRQEYLSLRDELFKSRARANAVASQLYSTRVQIKLTYTSGRYYNPAKATIRLDGAAVFENATGGIAGDDGIRFEGFVAPGRHLITFRVEAQGKDDDSFTSVTENQITVKAVAGKDLIVSARARDSGDIAYEWKRNEKGSYGLGLDVSVKSIGRPDAPAPKGKK
ncbi:MAG: hypothetical protein H0V17_26785 [Deltaproteobacteria bacterium]|nr:hypothetical protein [Deltaproteobacteria bacterium]